MVVCVGGELKDDSNQDQTVNKQSENSDKGNFQFIPT